MTTWWQQAGRILWEGWRPSRPRGLSVQRHQMADKPDPNASRHQIRYRPGVPRPQPKKPQRADRARAALERWKERGRFEDAMAVMRYYQQWETAGRRDGWLAATGYDQLSASFLSRCRRCLPHYVAIKAWRDADPQRQRWNSPDLVWQKFQEATVDDAEGEGATVAVLSPVPVA